MEQFEPYLSLALALVAGLLIGLEREQSRPAPDTGRGFPGGIRTYPLVALVGAVGALLSKELGPWPFLVVVVVLGALLTINYLRDVQSGHMGLTSEAAALLTLLLGALSTSTVVQPLRTRIFVVASIAVATTMLLSAKTTLRKLSDRVSRDDVIATLKFLMVAVVIFPVLPDEPLGPYGALNPFRIGLLVMLIAGLSFAGYVAIRLLGQGRGLLLTGAIGGLVSSTAVTLSSASRAKETPRLAHMAALAVVIASSLMFGRVLVTVFVVERSLVPRLVAVMVMAVVAAVVTLVFYLRERTHETSTEGLQLKNPFELRAAVQFAVFFVVIIIISRWAHEHLGTSGSYLTGAIAGLTDVDAITLTMSNLVKNEAIEPSVAARTIGIAAVTNTVMKGGLALALGGREFGLRVIAAFAFVIVSGAVALVAF